MFAWAACAFGATSGFGQVTEVAKSRAPAPAPGWSTEVRARQGSPIALNARLAGDSAQTRLTIELTSATSFQVFRLQAPDRVVVDLANVGFRLPPGSGQTAVGLVKAFRYGAFAPGKSRIVMDTTAPVRVEATRLIDAPGGKGHRLEIDLVRVDAIELAASEMAAAMEGVPLPAPVAASPSRSASRTVAKDGPLPVITIDPGHGGIDSGAQGTLGAEKDITLAVSRELARALQASGRYKVFMTRSTDIFIRLEDRVRISQQNGSNLFISIHADSLASAELAKSVRGASIYTLSRRATNAAARRYAEKENAADIIAGLLPAQQLHPDDHVADILLDLMRRETSNLSIDARRTLARHLRHGIKLTHDPQRAADFVVLRQAATPSVLIELGYVTHQEDQRLMRSGEWQRKVVGAIAAAVHDYFARNPARGRHAPAPPVPVAGPAGPTAPGNRAP